MEFSGFDWDHGNRDKCRQHGVSTAVIEALFSSPIAILPDNQHALSERRFRAVGKTKEGRSLFVVFTMRHRGDVALIRPISARYMHLREVVKYEKENPDIQDG